MELFLGCVRAPVSSEREKGTILSHQSVTSGRLAADKRYSKEGGVATIGLFFTVLWQIVWDLQHEFACKGLHQRRSQISHHDISCEKHRQAVFVFGQRGHCKYQKVGRIVFLATTDGTFICRYEKMPKIFEDLAKSRFVGAFPRSLILIIQ